MLQFLTAKTLTIFFALATTAFCIATIILAVENSNLENDLTEALEKLDQILQTTTTPRTTIVTTTSVKTTENPVTSVSTTDSPSTTNDTENLPTYPTLPPNLPDPGGILRLLFK
uniref:Uncharacterized protein n=1 Tax=Glossina palpalis gambiensis TaxID=67801 RepID=A0A1B0BGU5_9MUSC